MAMFFAILGIVLLLALGVLLALIAITPKVTPVNESILSSLPTFLQDYSDLPERTSYTARDGSRLDYRYYSSHSDTALILLHGISQDGQYLHSLGKFISQNHLAQVYIPDLRGYGIHPQRRGDCDYIGQIEDDLADLITHIRKEKLYAQMILAGHSMGGGTVIRCAAGRYSHLFDSYLLLAPAVSPNAPMNYPKEESTNLIGVALPRIIGLTILNQMGIKLFNHLTVLVKNKEEETTHGIESRKISYRLALSRMPNMKFERDLKALNKPTLVLIGEDDEEFKAEEYAPLFQKYNDAEVRVLPHGLTHDSIILSEYTYKAINDWMKGTAPILPSPEPALKDM